MNDDDLISDTETTGNDPLERIQARRYLSELNHFLLHDEGEFKESPGKISLVWNDPMFEVRRYLSVKASGSDQILVNGKRYPATESSLKQALVTCMKELH